MQVGRGVSHEHLGAKPPDIPQGAQLGGAHLGPFLPVKMLIAKMARKEVLNEYGNLDSTLVIYESPFRVSKLLDEIGKFLGNRYVSICSELTKIHENINRGHVDEIDSSTIVEKGEYVVLVAKEGYSGGK